MACATRSGLYLWICDNAQSNTYILGRCWYSQKNFISAYSHTLPLLCVRAKVLQPGRHQQHKGRHEFKISQTILTLNNLATIFSLSHSIIQNIYGYHFKMAPSFENGQYKDVIVDSLKFLVKEKWVEVRFLSVMSNHIRSIWQIQDGL